MARLNLSQVLTYTGGRLLDQTAPVAELKGASETAPAAEHPGGVETAPAAERPDAELVFGDVSTDTRTVCPGDLYLALRGARFDGHDFLVQAADAGATGLLIDEQAAGTDSVWQLARNLAVVVVPDTLTALQDLAAGYRNTLTASVIAITGSVGKTSTRGLVAACLSPLLKICQTQANNNNEIGLPKTLLAATPQDQAIVLEMGMRGRGEIELLSKIAQPDIALITNIGVAHIERLGSQEEIFQAKAEILAGLKPGGRIILNADDPFLLKLAQELLPNQRVSLVATQTSAISSKAPNLTVFAAQDLALDHEGCQYTLQIWPERPQPLPQRVTLPVPGRHMVSNSLFGLAVADSLGLDLAAAAAGAQHFENTGNRQRLLQMGSLLVMDDSYNASPESMLAALETLQAIAGERRLVAALGGMLELGDYAAKAHARVGLAAARHGFSLVLTIGPHAADVKAGFAAGQSAGQSAGRCEAFDTQQDLIERLLSCLEPHDVVLVKGSRGFAMEQVTAAIQQHAAELGGSEHP